MSEQRFTLTYPNIIRSNYCFKDNGKGLTDEEVCEKLNEQQSTISALKEENGQLKNRLNGSI